MEVRATGNDTAPTADGDRVFRDYGYYRLLVATTTRDFVLVAEHTSGQRTKVVTTRLPAERESSIAAR